MKKTLLLFLFISTSFMEEIQSQTKNWFHPSTGKNVYAQCLTPDGEKLIVTNVNELTVYSMMEQKDLFKLQGGHRGRILTMDVSSNGKLLVSAGTDSTVVVWDLEKKCILDKLNYHQGYVTSVRFSHNGHFVLSGGTDRKVVLYNLDKNEIVHIFRETEDDVLCVGFSPDDQLIACSGLNQPVRLFQTSDFKQVYSINESPRGANSFDFNYTQTKLVVGGVDGNLSFWDITEPTKVKFEWMEQATFNWILQVKFGLDGQFVTLSNFSGQVFHLSPSWLMRKKVGAPVLTILFQSQNEDTLLLGTKGKGMMRLNVQDMAMELNGMPYRALKMDRSSFFPIRRTNIQPDGKNPIILSLLVQNKLDSADVKLNAIKRKDVNPDQFRFLLTDLLIRKNMLDSALLIAEQSLERNPYLEPMLCASAWLWEQKGDSTKASAYYRKALDRLEYVKYYLNDSVQLLRNDLDRLYLKKRLNATLPFKLAYTLFKSDISVLTLADRFLGMTEKRFILKVLEGNENMVYANEE